MSRDYLTTTVPNASGTVEGVWDVDEATSRKLFGVPGVVGPRYLEIAPKGYAWPWYPVFVGRAEFDTTVPGESNLVTLNFQWTEGPRRERVGIKRWLKRNRNKDGK